MNRDLAYVRHMLDCIRRIEAATVDGRTVFLDSDLAQDAVARNLQTLTESSKRLSSEVKSSRPEIEWERIWDVVATDVPTLRAALEAILARLERPSD